MPVDELAAADVANADAEDIRLMTLSGQGDMAAFERLIERRQALVVGTVARMLGGGSDVEDIAQQVFIRVWRSAPRYTPSAKFTTWLLKITRNLVFNELRRRKNKTFLPIDAAQGEDDRQIPTESHHTPDALLLDSELAAAINHAIAQLPETQRMALVLRRYEELSYDEIAEVLDQTVPAVKSLLFRARTELRQRLSKYLDS